MKNFRIKKNGNEVMVIGSQKAELITIQINDGMKVEFPMLSAECNLEESEGFTNKYQWKELVKIESDDVIEISLTEDNTTSEPEFWYEHNREIPKDYEGEHCSFCNKKNEEVESLLQGKNKIFVCNECITLLSELLHENNEKL